ncbi:MAG: glycerate kinase [Oscillospiraceae bacterium]|nr:glycerate kinase [Oscillospiraceae bacterium]
MKAVIAIDSFKGCMTSLQAGNAAARGIRSVRDAEVEVYPIADGGEGTCSVLTDGLGGEYTDVCVHDPIGRIIKARYGIIPERRLAIMEMAASSGLTLVPEDMRDPSVSNTLGLGEMILDAIGKGCREFMIGIGGSATTEAGIGMLAATGYRFLKADGTEASPCITEMKDIVTVDDSLVVPELDSCVFHIACDVDNPLCGERGAVRIFGKQKGVAAEDMDCFDSALRRFGEVSEVYSGRNSVMDAPGAGASGGLGFAFLNYFKNVDLRPGLRIVCETIGLDEAIKNADVVITGEGSLDSQTKLGKVPFSIGRIAKEFGVKTVAFCGAVDIKAAEDLLPILDACVAITPSDMELHTAMLTEVAEKNMERAVKAFFS